MASRTDLEELRERADRNRSGAKESLLRDIVDAYERTPRSDEDARALRRLFVENLPPDIDVSDERLARFVKEHIEPSDFEALEVSSPQQVRALFELLYSFPFKADGTASRLEEHVDHLLRSALRQFEERGQLEQMFRLLQVAPPTDRSNPELIRLRSRAYLYEVARAHRRRRLLYVYLVAQTVLVAVVFPFLFVNAENGKIQRQIDETMDIEVDEGSPRQFLSFGDGLYWSVITAASIGYGDVTPHTRVGRFIAATLGTMGVVTIGVVAGLILHWLTPRRLE